MSFYSFGDLCAEKMQYFLSFIADKPQTAAHLYSKKYELDPFIYLFSSVISSLAVNHLDTRRSTVLSFSESI